MEIFYYAIENFLCGSNRFVGGGKVPKWGYFVQRFEDTQGGFVRGVVKKRKISLSTVQPLP